MNINESKKIAQSIIAKFPKSKSGEPYLSLKNGRKLFLNRFIKKYELHSQKSKYNSSDLKRRIICIEFFDYFTKNFELHAARTSNRLILESYFHRMVILERKVGVGNKYELLSFYPK